MCIRDRDLVEAGVPLDAAIAMSGELAKGLQPIAHKLVMFCLLYTSDAADERSSVDLGGRRIIKKKSNELMVTRLVWLTKQQMNLYKD